MNEEENKGDEQTDAEQEYFSDEDAERFFNQEEMVEEEEIETSPQRPWIKKIIAVLLSVVLLGNIIAFMPQIYSFPAIQFLKKNRELSQNEHIQQYKQAIVTVNAQGRKGTGFNISADGLVITNHHVVEDEKLSVVKFPHGQSYTAELTISDPDMDIAILRIKDHDKQSALPVLELAPEMALEIGMPFYVIGNPLFFYQIANEGQIFGIPSQQFRESPVILLDAPIYKGNSGSPVIGENGKVIAVVFATTKVKFDNHSKKVGLATPIDEVKKLLEDS